MTESTDPHDEIFYMYKNYLFINGNHVTGCFIFVSNSKVEIIKDTLLTLERKKTAVGGKFEPTAE